jgi:hypothetical protein
MQIPAHIMARAGQESALAKSITGGITGGDFGPRISIKGSRFRIIEGSEETVLPSMHLDVVIVGANPRLSKSYYSKAWDPNDVGAPDCSSLGGVSPSDDAPSPQSDLCASCAHNQWGSKIGPQGQKLKACTDMKRLAVISPDDLEGPVYLLQVTPSALKGLDAFQKALSSRGIAPEVVKTRLTFDTSASFPKLVFGLGGFLEENEIEIVDAVIAGDVVKQTTGEEDPNLLQTTTVTTKAAPKPQMVRAAAAPAPEPEPVAEPAAPKRGFGKAAAPAPVAAPAKAAVKPAAKAAKPAPKAMPAETAVSDIEAEIAAMVEAEGSDDAA